ncbi:MAG TPA: hypothetical protein DIU00_07145 [Phycisphaerales bacterium]|nr:hypothetical protein [Phycisphaerales bacterium]
MFSQGKAIPIPINDNRDEAATQYNWWKTCGSLKRQSLGDALWRLGMVANTRGRLNTYFGFEAATQ